MSNHQTEGDKTLPATHPDAELIATCEQHIVNLRAFNASQDPVGPEDDPLWTAYTQTHAAIEEAEPQTIAGMLALARVVKAEALQRDGSERPESGTPARWSWHLVNDLLRLKEKGVL